MTERRLELFVPADLNMAVGIAARLMMNHPAFSRQPFGFWTQTLEGQAKLGHHAFVMDDARQVVGFVGYALTTKARAEAWKRGEMALAYDECRHGDCVIFQAWIANDRFVHRFLVNAARKILVGRDTMYYKRVYRNGSARIVAQPINAFIESHLARASGRRSGTAANEWARVA